MKNLAKWIEVPVSDLNRAKKFYQSIFDIELTDMEFPNGLKMSMFPSDQESVGGALCYHPEFYKPGAEGPLVYFNADNNMNNILSRIEEHGGEVFTPRTQISEEYGYMAVFKDSEGNRVALHSND